MGECCSPRTHIHARVSITEMVEHLRFWHMKGLAHESIYLPRDPWEGGGKGQTATMYLFLDVSAVVV